MVDKLSLMNYALLGEKEGNDRSNQYEDFINSQDTIGKKNACLIACAKEADATVAALMKRKKLNPEQYPNAFLADKIDGSNKENPHFLLQTAGVFLTSFSTSLAVRTLSRVPVVGKYVGNTLAIASLVGKGVHELNRAKAIAKSENRTLNRRDYGKIAANTALAIAPYAVTMATAHLGVVGTAIGRSVGAVGMAVKTYFADLNKKKMRLREDEKLNAKDYLTSIGKAAAKGAAMWLGGLAAGYTVDAAMGGTMTQQPNQSTMPDEKLTTANITADENSLKALREHEFDLTDYTRATANPDNDQMWQHGKQVDWYNKGEYDRAVKVLHEAGVKDADGAIRNLAGAKMFKGGEFATELDNLTHGKLTTNTINKIFEADALLDRTADLMHSNGGVELPSHVQTEFAQSAGAELPETSANYDFNETQTTVQPEPVNSSTELPEATTNYSFTQTNEQYEQFEPESEPVVAEPLATFNIESNPSSELLPNHDFTAPEIQSESELLPAHDFGPESAYEQVIRSLNDHEMPNSVIHDNVNITPKLNAVDQAMIKPDQLLADAKVVFDQYNSPDMSAESRTAAIDAIKDFNTRLEHQMSLRPGLAPAEAQRDALENLITNNPEYVENFQNTTGYSLETKYMDLSNALDNAQNKNLDSGFER